MTTAGQAVAGVIGALVRSDMADLVICQNQVLGGRLASVDHSRGTRRPGPRRRMPQPGLVGGLTEQAPSLPVVWAGWSAGARSGRQEHLAPCRPATRWCYRLV